MPYPASHRSPARVADLTTSPESGRNADASGAHGIARRRRSPHAAKAATDPPNRRSPSQGSGRPGGATRTAAEPWSRAAQNASPTGPTGPEARPVRLFLRHGAGFVPVQTTEILWLRAADNYLQVRALGRSYLARLTLAEAERRLDPTRFIRIRHSLIVNLDHVQMISSWSGREYRFLLDDGTEVISTRKYRAAIRALLIP